MSFFNYSVTIMICQDYLIFFCDFIDQRLDENQKRAIEEHCLQCKSCAIAWKNLLENVEKVRNLRRFSVSPSFVLDVMNRLEKKQGIASNKAAFYSIFSLAACFLLGITAWIFFSSDFSFSKHQDTLALNETMNLAQAEATKELENIELENIEEENKAKEEPGFNAMEKDAICDELESVCEEKAKSFQNLSTPSGSAPPSSPKILEEKGLAYRKMKKHQNFSYTEKISLEKKTLSLEAIKLFSILLEQKNKDKTLFTVQVVFDENKLPQKIEIVVLSNNLLSDQEQIKKWLSISPEFVLWEYETKQKNVGLFQKQEENGKTILNYLENSFVFFPVIQYQKSLLEGLDSISLSLWITDF